MRTLTVFLLAACCAAFPSTQPAARGFPHRSTTFAGPADVGQRPSGQDTTLLAALRGRIAAVPGAQVGLYFEDIGSGESFGIHDTVTFHAASTMKVPVMFELFRQVDQGRLDLDATITLENRFLSIVDRSPYQLELADDSDSTLYARIGSPISLRELNERMIVRSSNLATNVLIERLDPTRVTSFARSLGGAGVVVRRGVEDIPAFRAGLNNETTAKGLGKLLAALERGQVASPASTAAMRGTLLRQEFADEIPAGLPPGTRVAHKTGWITATTHDAAIVYPPGRAPFVLVILTRAIPERAVAQRLMADCARLVWDAYATRGVGSATTSR